MRKQLAKNHTPRRRGKDGQRDRGFELFEYSPLTTDRTRLQAALVEAAHQKISEFPILIERLIRLLRTKYPPHILAVLAGYGLTTGVSEKGVDGRSFISNIEQHHVELLQALALTLRFDEWGQEPAIPDDVQLAIDNITALGTAFHQRRLLALETTDPQEHLALALQEKLRMHTQLVRNWGYFSNVARIADELYKPLDAAFQAKGFGPTQLIKIARALIGLIEERHQQRWKIIRNVFREKTIPRLVRKYYQRYPDVKGAAEDFLRIIPPSATLKMVKAKLLSHADIALVSHCCITPDVVAEKSGVALDRTKAVLDFISLLPGDLAEQHLEHLFLSNPVWIAPAINVNGEYFCSAPQIVFSFIHDIVAGMADKPELKRALEARRARYLEQKMADLLIKALPGAQHWLNVKFHTGSIEYENDLVLKLDRTIIIAEAKSAHLTAPALRGAADRVRRHVRELILEPSEQSARLEQLILRARAGDKEAIVALKDFGERFWDVDLVVRISVTLDDFSILSSSERDLKSAGWIPESAQLAATLNIADLECVTDILEDPARTVHYFAERQRFQAAINVFADEMDFLGFYLSTGFNVPEVESHPGRVSLSGMSQVVDHFYCSRDAGVKVPKPKAKVGVYFGALLAAVQARKRPGWLSISMDILRSTNYAAQKRLERDMEKIRQNVERNWRNPDHECSLVYCPSAHRESVIMFYIYPPELESQRKELISTLSGKALEISGRSRCVVVARNTARWTDPYSFVGIARPPQEGATADR